MNDRKNKVFFDSRKNNSIFSMTGNGLKDWFLQRITAWYLLFYVFFLFFFLVFDHTYVAWHALFACEFFKIATFFALLAGIVHAWVGVWTIFTDYIKFPFARIISFVILLFFLLFCFIWGITIIF